MSGEVGVVDRVVQILQIASLSRAITALSTGCLRKGLVLGEDVVEQGTLAPQNRTELGVERKVVTCRLTGPDSLVVVLADRGQASSRASWASE